MIFGSYSDAGLIAVGIAVGASAMAIIFQQQMQHRGEEAEHAASITEKKKKKSAEEAVKRDYD